VYAKLMTTMSAFVSYQGSFNTALDRFLADPAGEADEAKAQQRKTVLDKFEIHFNHHVKLHLDAVT
jgi:gamma-tubulin complex component 2